MPPPLLLNLTLSLSGRSRRNVQARPPSAEQCDAAEESRQGPQARRLLPGEARAARTGACQQCGGVGTIPGRQGQVPCPTCQPWRRRPDFKPNSPLLSPTDLDLSVLDAPALASDGAGQPHGIPQRRPRSAAGPGLAPVQQQQQEAERGSGRSSPQLIATDGASGPPLAEEAGPGAGGLPIAGASAVPAAKSKWHTMTEAKREAIRQGALRKGEHTPEHRRKIARAVREAHAKDPSLRLALAKKTCSYCGQEGHTRRGCPQLKADAGEAAVAAGTVQEAPRKRPGPKAISEERRRALAEMLRQMHADNPSLRLAAKLGKGVKKACSYCGGEGHTRPTCPQRKADQAAQIAQGAAGAVMTRRAASRCGYCGQEGHTRRSCPELKAAAGLLPVEEPAEAPTSPQDDTSISTTTTTSSSSSSSSSTVGATKTCSVCGGRGHTRRSCPSLRAGRGSSSTGATKTCSVCGGRGHTQRTCPALKSRGREGLGATSSPAAAGVSLVSSTAADSGSSAPQAGVRKRKRPTCGLCGEVGHMRVHCPRLWAALSPEALAAIAQQAQGTQAGPAAASAVAEHGQQQVTEATAAAAEAARASAEVAEAPTGAAAPAPEAQAPAEAQLQPALDAGVELLGEWQAEGAAIEQAAGPLSAGGGTDAPAEAGQGLPASAASSAQATAVAGAISVESTPSGLEAGGPTLPVGCSEAGIAADTAIADRHQPTAAAAAPLGLTAEGDSKGNASQAKEPAALDGEPQLQQQPAADPSPQAQPSVSGAVSSSSSSGARTTPQVPQSSLPASAPAQPQEASALSVKGPVAPQQPQAPAPSRPLQQSQSQPPQAVAAAVPSPKAPPVPPLPATQPRDGRAFGPAGLPTQALGSGMRLDPDGGLVFPLPRRQADCMQQASQAVLRAWEDGIRWQCLELPLPLNNAPAEGGWPGGIRQQYRVALPTLEGLLRRLKAYPGLEGRITAEWLDQSDCVGAWQSEKLAAVLFPTADTLPALRQIENALSGQRLMLVVNPQWQVEGQVISDFGFGQARRRAEQFVSLFEDIYCLRRARVRGEEVRILKCYPGAWQVYYIRNGDEPLLLACEDTKPCYQRLEELMAPILARKANWLQQWLGAWGGDTTARQDPAFDPDGGWWPDEAIKKTNGKTDEAGGASTDVAAVPREGGRTSSVAGAAPTAPQQGEAAGSSGRPGSPAGAQAGAALGQEGADRGGGAYRMRRVRQQQRGWRETDLREVSAVLGIGAGGSIASGSDSDSESDSDSRSTNGASRQATQASSSTSTGSSAAGDAAAARVAQQRDIITGEPLDEAGDVVRDYEGEGAQVARDYRMQPVKEMAKWVFGREGGPPAKR
ncbi:hypothetical protein N2152v2_006799 [Parachlorella kessleri]